ncbi:MAG: 1-deoxy-D-xylulose-5-phosphate reductoisomerase [Alphaproteobacteria bacterium]|nr:1-deoxy-D-xylulose-5-phosphate reductoisomerase [Alphaproteobacteria bacterium]
MRSVSILGATGSVGASTLDLIERAPDRFRVVAVTAHHSVERLADIAKRTRADVAAIADPAALPALRVALAGTHVRCLAGPEGVEEAAAVPSDLVMAAIVGVAGLAPTLTAIRRGATVAFASKECLVAAGDLMMAEVARHGATLLPVDSEHNAIFQVLEAHNRSAIEALILTASGGPFRTWTVEQMAAATPADAIRHPVWSMGAKISVDSATLMNKGLEVIEAAHLFQMPEPQVRVLVHPQSVVHSMVAYTDGSVLAQLGTPDMRIPIAHALAYPDRMPTPAERLSLERMATLTFEPPDEQRFPALRLARQALIAGGTMPAILNAANEVAVAAFLAGRIGFLDIAALVAETMAQVSPHPPVDLAAVAAVDDAARRAAEHLIQCRGAAV